MKIGIDCQCLQSHSKNRGIGKYTREFIENLAKKNFYILLFVNSYHEYEIIKDIAKKFKNVEIKFLFCNLNKFFFDSCDLNSINRILKSTYELEINNYNLDHYLIPSFFEKSENYFIFESFEIDCPVSLIIYDFIPMEFKDYFLIHPDFKDKYYKKLNELQNFSCLLFISKSSYNYFKENFSNIKINYQIIYGDKEISIKHNKINPEKKYILSVVSNDSHKNLLNLIEAYNLLNEHLKNTYALYIVNSYIDDNIKKKINDLKIKNIKFFSNILDEQIDYLYENCSLYVQPSLQEGLSLTLIEVAKRGKKIACSNIPVFRELFQTQKFMFNPNDKKDIAKIIDDAIHSSDKLELNSDKYIWKNTINLFINKIISYKKNNIQIFPDYKEYFFNAAKKYIALEKSNLLKNIFFNNFNNEKSLPYKNIFVDLSHSINLNINTGIQRVTFNFLENLYKITSTHFSNYRIIPVFLDSNDCLFRYVDHQKLKTKIDIDFNYDTKHQNELVEFYKNDIFFLLDLNPSLNNIFHKNLSFFKQLKCKDISISTIVYDLFPVNMPDFFPKGTKEGYNFYFKNIFSISDKIITISNFTKNEVMQFIKSNNIKNKMQIKTIYLGQDSIKNKIVKKNGLKFSNFILMVGTLEPRKNYEYAIKLFCEFDKINNNGTKLVIAGNIGWDQNYLSNELFKNKLFNKKIFHLTPDDNELDYLYANCNFLLNTSHNEGFCLPVAEAYKYKKNILSSQIEVIKEIFGKNIDYLSNEINSDVVLMESLVNNKKFKMQSFNAELLNSWSEQSLKLMKFLV